MMRWIGLSVVIACCWGCQRPAKIKVEPDNPLLKSMEDSVRLQATVLDQQGKTLPGAKVAFKSMTPTMANVSANGVVHPVTSGTATILVTAGSVSKNVEVLIQIPKKIKIEPTAESQFSGDFLLMLGVKRGFKATVINDRDRPMIAGDIRWSSSDPEIFTVDKHGTVKTIKEGATDLNAFAAGIKGSVKITVKHEELTEDGMLVQ